MTKESSLPFPSGHNPSPLLALALSPCPYLPNKIRACLIPTVLLSPVPNSVPNSATFLLPSKSNHFLEFHPKRAKFHTSPQDSDLGGNDEHAFLCKIYACAYLAFPSLPHPLEGYNAGKETNFMWKLILPGHYQSWTQGGGSSEACQSPLLPKGVPPMSQEKDDRSEQGRKGLRAFSACQHFLVKLWWAEMQTYSCTH